MLPVTLSLGLINFNLFINSTLGSTVSEDAPRAIDAAFRIYMLPQGMFSVAVATVLFPALARLATRRDFDGLRALTGTGTRQIFLLLIPAAACTLVLAEPITRLVYERGEFGAGLDASSSPRRCSGSPSACRSRASNLLLTRTFFSLQRPWLPTGARRRDAASSTSSSRSRSYGPFGIGGIVFGTAVASAAMTVGPGVLPAPRARRATSRARETARRASRGSSSRRRCSAAVAYGAVARLDELARPLAAGAGRLGRRRRSSPGIAVYALAVLALRVPEAQQIRDAVGSRLRAPARLSAPPISQAGIAPGRPSSTTNDARVLTGAPGRVTNGTTRKSERHRSRSTVQRT